MKRELLFPFWGRVRIKWDNLCFKTCFVGIKALHKYLCLGGKGRGYSVSTVFFKEQVVSHQQVTEKNSVGPDHHSKMLIE